MIFDKTLIFFGLFISFILNFLLMKPFINLLRKYNLQKREGGVGRKGKALIDTLQDDGLKELGSIKEVSAKVQKMRKFFISRFRDYFRLGQYNRMVIDKPYGYRGDFMTFGVS